MNPSAPSESPSERELFFEALAIVSMKERSVFLNGACFNQPDLRRRVDELLASHAEQDDFMQESALDSDATLLDSSVISEGPGTTIGRYKLLQKVGEGGMGVVYMAEQTEPIVRKTALKIIKLGMDTKQVVARFDAERQALAMMDHPNIAKVLDAGATDTGRPYFVMELVRGVPITEYCDKAKLSTRQRLELFIPLCQAIQSAHQKGIIHRDIKPSNVMVTLHDGNPMPKVIDFGIAKATNQKLTEKTLFTNYSQMIGTPAYMSPEQAEMSGSDVDTRTDVYSLGVLLYELLTGTTPFPSKELLSLGYGEMQKLIAEKEPPKPSTRMSTMQYEDQTAMATNRSMEVSALSTLFQGDLDWIVMKALEKDRAHRYESVSGLVADVKRHLNDEPVSAAAPTFRYQLQKFYRRNKAYMLAVGVVGGLLILTATVTTLLAIHASNLRDVATRAQADAELERNHAIQEQEKAQALADEREKSLYFERIARAQSELVANHPADALDLLKECPMALRNWEWHHLYRRCVSSPPDPLVFPSPVISISCNTSGSRIAALCEDGKIRIRGIVTEGGPELVAPNWSPDQISPIFGWWPVQWIALHPSGNQLAVIKGGNEVSLIDSNSGDEIRSFSGHSDRINSIAISPSGAQLATSSLDKTVRLWNCNDGAQQFEIFHGNWTTGLVFTPDGKRLITGSFSLNRTVRIWDTATGLELNTFEDDHESILNIAVNLDGTKIATGGANHTVFVRDLEGGEPIRMQGNYKGVMRVAFNSDSSRLISGGEDRTIRLWETSTGREILNLHQTPRDVMNLTFLPDGSKIVGGSHGNVLTLLDGSQWTKQEETTHITLSGHQNPVLPIAYHPSRPLIASGSRDGSLRLWDLEANEQDSFPIGGYIFDVSFNPQGTHILSTGFTDDNMTRVDIRNVLSPTKRRAITTVDRAIRGARFSPDGQYVVWGGVSNVQVWDWGSGTLVGSLNDSSRQLWKLAFSPNGRHLVTAHTDGMVRLWDGSRLTKPQESRLVYANGSTFLRPSFSHDSRFLAVGDFEGKVTLLSVVDGTTKFSIESAHGEFITCTAFSSDGRFLATGAADRTVRLWDAATGGAVKTFLGHNDLINCLAFSADNSQLASSSDDKTVKIWDLPE